MLFMTAKRVFAAYDAHCRDSKYSTIEYMRSSRLDASSGWGARDVLPPIRRVFCECIRPTSSERGHLIPATSCVVHDEA